MESASWQHCSIVTSRGAGCALPHRTSRCRLVLPGRARSGSARRWQR